MRLLILGATGPCGIALIRKALAVHPDYIIVVYARNPQKLPNDIQNNASVTVIQGTLDELDKVEQALEGVDAVISALGPIPFQTVGTPIADFYGHFIDLLYKHNIKRFMPLATPSHRDEHDGKQWKFTTLVTVIRNIANSMYSEMVGIGKVVTTKGADLDYTIVRVPMLSNGNSEKFVAGYVGTPGLGIVLARKAYAAFCIEELEKREWVKKAPAISNA